MEKAGKKSKSKYVAVGVAAAVIIVAAVFFATGNLNQTSSPTELKTAAICNRRRTSGRQRGTELFADRSAEGSDNKADIYRKASIHLLHSYILHSLPDWRAEPCKVL